MYSQTNHFFEVKSILQGGSFSGYASAYTVDQQHDIIEPGAFQKSLQGIYEDVGMPKMLWQHDPSQPIGKWESIREDTQGLYVEGRLFLELPKAKEAYVLLKERVVDGLSIGFEVVRANRTEKGRRLQEVKLHEISLVTFPANGKARVHQVKKIHCDEPLQQQLDYLIALMRG